MKNALIWAAMLVILYMEGCHLIGDSKKPIPQYDSITSQDTHREVSQPMLPKSTQPHPAQGVSVPHPRPRKSVTLDSLMQRINILDYKLEQLRKQPPPAPAEDSGIDIDTEEDEFLRFWTMLGLFVLSVIRPYLSQLLPWLARIGHHLPFLTDLINWFRAMPRRSRKPKQ